MNKIYCFLPVFMLFFLSCASEQGKKKEQNTIKTIPVKYAKGFTVQDYGNYKLVDMCDPSGKSQMTYHYALVDKGAKVGAIDQKYTIIQLPVTKVICMTSPQIANFIKLDKDAFRGR